MNSPSRLGVAAVLATMPLSAQVTLPEALDTPGWEWTTSAANPFIGIQSAEAEEDGDLARGVIIPPGNNIWGGEFENWIETTLTGPGVFKIRIRSSGDPYLEAILQIDGNIVDYWRPEYQWGPPAPSDWRVLSGAIHSGSHTVRVRGGFGFAGTLVVDTPAFEVDHAELLPLGPLIGEAMNATEQLWYGGGDVSVVTNAEAHDNSQAIRMTLTQGTAWIETAVTGPATVSWWRKGPAVIHLDGLATAFGSEVDWIRESFFVPPGEQVARWSRSDQSGGGIATVDEFTSQSESEVPLATALDTNQVLTQGGGGVWRGITSAAATDGVDLAWTQILPGAAPTWLETIIEGPAALEYEFAVRGDVQLSVTDNGHQIDSGHGLIFREHPGTHRTILPPGTHRIRFEASPGPSQFSAYGLFMLDQLTVTPLSSVPVSEALDALDLTWNSGGDQPWSGVLASLAPDATDALVSPELASGESAWLETSVTGPGTFSFQWTHGWDHANDWDFFVDGESLRWAYTHRQEPFYSRFLELGPGVHTLLWHLEGPRAGASLVLDQVRWNPAAQPATSDALDLPPSNIHWHNIGWDHAPGEGRAGGDALRFGIPGTYAHLTDLSLQIEGPAMVSFYAKTGPSCRLQFRADNDPRVVITTENAWQQFHIQIPPGKRTLNFLPSSSTSQPAAENSVWIDEVLITPNELPLATVLNANSAALTWTTNPANPWQGIDRIGQSDLVAAGPEQDEELSWLESQVQGPAVVKFLARGQGLSSNQPGLRVLVDGTQSTAVASASQKWVILYFPMGEHTLRLEAVAGFRNLTPEISAFNYAPMAGEPTIRMINGNVELTVPRPTGFADDQISMNLSERLELLGLSSSRAYHSEVFQSTPAAVVIRCDLSLYPVTPQSLYAAARFEP